MKENLRTDSYANGDNIPSCSAAETNSDIYYKTINNSNLYSETTNNYGLHYTWAAAMNGAPGNYAQPVQGICPNGWHVPTKAEFEELLATVGNDMNALKENSDLWTVNHSEFTNASGFSLRPSGYSYYDCSESSSQVGQTFELLTASQSSENNFYYFNTYGQFYTNGKTAYMDAVRCIRGQGESVFPASVSTYSASAFTSSKIRATGVVLRGNGSLISKGFCYSTTNQMPTVETADTIISDTSAARFVCEIPFSDPSKTYYIRAFVRNSAGVSYGEVKQVVIMNVSCSLSSFTTGGFTYHTVQIGGQCWLKENLRLTPSGSSAYNGLQNNEDYDLTAPWGMTQDFVYYPGYRSGQTTYTDYGYLYNRWCAMNNGSNTYGSSSNQSGVQGICPTGWHIPSKAEFNDLVTLLGGASAAYTKLMSTTGWSSAVGTNESGFNAQPTGYYNLSSGGTSASATGRGAHAYFWVSDMYNSQNYNAYYLNPSSTSKVYSISRSINEADAFAVRCLKNRVSFNATTATSTGTSGDTQTFRLSTRITATNGLQIVEYGYITSSDNNPAMVYVAGDNSRLTATYGSTMTATYTTSQCYNKVRPYVLASDGHYYYGDILYFNGPGCIN